MLHDINDWIVRSPPITPGRTDAAIRSRQKKRTLEEQLKKWRNSSGGILPTELDKTNTTDKATLRNRRRRHSIGSHVGDDGPPPLIDCDEDDAAKLQNNEIRSNSSSIHRQSPSSAAKTRATRSSKRTESTAVTETGWVAGGFRGRHQRRASTGHYQESTSDGFELVESSLFASTEANVLRPKNDSMSHRLWEEETNRLDSTKDDGHGFLQTNESFDNTWDDWPEMSVTSEVSSSAHKSVSIRHRHNPAINNTTSPSNRELGPSSIGLPLGSFPERDAKQITGEDNISNDRFETSFFAMAGRRASMGSVVSKDSSTPETPRRTPRRGSLGTINGGLFLSPPRPPSLGLRLGAMAGNGHSPTGQSSPNTQSSSGKNTRRPSFGSGSVASAKTGYSANSGCDASRSSLGSSRASISSGDVGRVVLIRGVVRESSRSSLGSKGILSISDASRGSSIGSVRTGVSEGTNKSGVTTSSGGKPIDPRRDGRRSSAGSINSTGSPKSVLIREGSRLKKALTLESIRSSVREAYQAPVSLPGTRSRTSISKSSKHSNGDHQKTSRGMASPESTESRSISGGPKESRVETSDVHVASNLPGSKARSPIVDSTFSEKYSTSDSNLPTSPRVRRRQRERSGSKRDLADRGEGQRISSSDVDKKLGGSLGAGNLGSEPKGGLMGGSDTRHVETSPKKSRRRVKRDKRGSLDALVGSLSPRLSRHRDRSNRDVKDSLDSGLVVGSPRSSRRKASRRHSSDGSSGGRDPEPDHKETRLNSKGYKSGRRNSIETYPVPDAGHESYSQEEPTTRRFMRRASTGSP